MIEKFEALSEQEEGARLVAAEACFQDSYDIVPAQRKIPETNGVEFEDDRYIQKLKLGISQGIYPESWSWETAKSLGFTKSAWAREAQKTIQFYDYMETLIQKYLNDKVVPADKKDAARRNLPSYVTIDYRGVVTITPHRFADRPGRGRDLSLDDQYHRQELFSLYQWFDKFGMEAVKTLSEQNFQSAETSEGSYPILPGNRTIQRAGHIDGKEYNLIEYELEASPAKGKNGEKKIEITGKIKFLKVPIYGYQNLGAEVVATREREPRQYDPGDRVLVMGPAGPKLIKADEVHSFNRQENFWKATQTAISVGFDGILTLSGAGNLVRAGNLLRAGFIGATGRSAVRKGLFQMGLGIAGVSHNAYWSSDPYLQYVGHARGLYFMAHAARNLASTLRLIRPEKGAPLTRFDKGLNMAAGGLESAFITSFALDLARLERYRDIKTSDLELRVRENPRTALIELRIEQLDRLIKTSKTNLKPTGEEEEHINRARNWLVELQKDPNQLESIRKQLSRQFLKHKNVYPISSMVTGIALLATFSEDYPEFLATFDDLKLRSHHMSPNRTELRSLRFDEVAKYLLNQLYVDNCNDQEKRQLGTILAGLGVVPLQEGIDMIFEGLRSGEPTARESLPLLMQFLFCQNLPESDYNFKKNIQHLRSLIAMNPGSVESKSGLEIWKALILPACDPDNPDRPDTKASFEDQLLQLRKQFDDEELNIMTRAEIFMLLANLHPGMREKNDPMSMIDMAMEMTHLIANMKETEAATQIKIEQFHVFEKARTYLEHQKELTPPQKAILASRVKRFNDAVAPAIRAGWQTNR